MKVFSIYLDDPLYIQMDIECGNFPVRRIDFGDRHIQCQLWIRIYFRFTDIKILRPTFLNANCAENKLVWYWALFSFQVGLNLNLYRNTCVRIISFKLTEVPLRQSYDFEVIEKLIRRLVFLRLALIYINECFEIVELYYLLYNLKPRKNASNWYKF